MHKIGTMNIPSIILVEINNREQNHKISTKYPTIKGLFILIPLNFCIKLRLEQNILKRGILLEP